MCAYTHKEFQPAKNQKMFPAADEDWMSKHIWNSRSCAEVAISSRHEPQDFSFPMWPWMMIATAIREDKGGLINSLVVQALSHLTRYF